MSEHCAAPRHNLCLDTGCHDLDQCIVEPGHRDAEAHLPTKRRLPTAPDTQPAPASGEGEALREARTLTVSWPGQCCDGYCIEAIGVHLVEREEAEWTQTAVSDLLARLVAERDEARERVVRAWDEGYLDGLDDQRNGYERTPNPYRAALGGEQAGDGGRECRRFFHPPGGWVCMAEDCPQEACPGWNGS